MKIKEYIAIATICVMSSMCTVYIMRNVDMTQPAFASTQEEIDFNVVLLKLQKLSESLLELDENMQAFNEKLQTLLPVVNSTYAQTISAQNIDQDLANIMRILNTLNNRFDFDSSRYRSHKTFNNGGTQYEIIRLLEEIKNSR